MWGVLGVDSIIPKDDNKLIEQKQSNGHHAYGLNPRLFTSELEFKERKENYDMRLKYIDAQYKAEMKDFENKKSLLRKQGQPVPQTCVRIESEHEKAELRKKASKTINDIFQKKNRLEIKITEMMDDQQLLKGWLKDLDMQQRIDIDLKSKNKYKLPVQNQEKQEKQEYKRSLSRITSNQNKLGKFQLSKEEEGKIMEKLTENMDKRMQKRNNEKEKILENYKYNQQFYE